ncbi:hypothetical protein OAK18_01090 [Candidatus Pelagibacter sp.]|nr:hypothetical protein [Candidatus Pelagibacter sp.]
MNKILKLMLGQIRIGVTVSKTLLFLWLKKDLRLIKGNLGIDLAGGSMMNKKFFMTKKYICVDLDEKKLKRGSNNFPDALPINDKIENFIKTYNQEKPDLLICIQTMGINSKFDHSHTLIMIKMIYDLLKPGGSMVFNVGSFGVNLSLIEKDLNEFFKRKFKSTKIRSYGFMDKTIEKPNSYLYFFLANLMNIIPPLRTCFGFNKTNIYCCFTKKLQD